MKDRIAFLVELAAALRESANPSVSGHFCAGFLWSLYPEWYDHNFGKQKQVDTVITEQYHATFGAGGAL